MLPFRAWRYAPRAGGLRDLIAPPYDVITPELQSTLYARSPHNVVRVDLGATSPDDDQSENQYTRAATLLSAWKEDGVLVRDGSPTLTFVEEHFTGPDGRAGHRHGFLATMRLSEFTEGTVFPHEHTLTGPKEDRFRLMTATAMSLSPVFLLYELPGDGITAACQADLGGRPPDSAVTDDLGNITSLWVASDPDLLRLVTESLRESRFLVADGHHRYETALSYRKARATAPGSSPGSPPASDFCLVYLANLADPALTIYPTHRLVSGLSADVVRDLPRSLASTFEVERLAETDRASSHAPASPGGTAPGAIAAYLQMHPRGAFGLWSPLLDAPYGFRLVDPMLARTSAEHSAAYQELDVSVLHALVLEKTLGISTIDLAAQKHLGYFKESSEAFARLQAGEFQAGFFMNPTGLDQVCEIAFGGERMPQKTTYFYPKLPTGLVFHDLAGTL